MHVCLVDSVVSDSLRTMDYSPPGSSVHGILQARILEWVAMPSSRGFSWPRDQTCISCVSCISRRVVYHYCHLEGPFSPIRFIISAFCSPPPAPRTVRVYFSCFKVLSFRSLVTKEIENWSKVVIVLLIIKINTCGTWICLPMQETQVWFLIREDPTCLWDLSPCS